MYELIN